MEFLTQPWFDAVQTELEANESLKTASANISLGVQQVVTDVPGGGEIKHNFALDHGAISIGLGELDAPDATMTATYEDAAALNRGDLDMMSAFAGGKLLVTGDLSVLMQHQAALGHLNSAFETLRDQTTYAG